MFKLVFTQKSQINVVKQNQNQDMIKMGFSQKRKGNLFGNMLKRCNSGNKSCSSCGR